MGGGRDPHEILARRLRALREERWPGLKVTQSQLAAALSSSEKRSVSVPLISAWESQTKPAIPPASRLEDYATFFATPRSFDGQQGRLLSLQELTEEERAAREELAQELACLRENAVDVPGPDGDEPGDAPEIAKSLRSGPWCFADGRPITIICARLPEDMLCQIPYASHDDPHYIEMYLYSDLDALFELHGHLRATNPTSKVNLRAAPQLQRDDYANHLVTLGGVDWNLATRSVMDKLQLPVSQVADWNAPGGAYFEVTEEDGRKIAHRPVLDEWGSREDLKEDVALFARALNPYNRKRFVTVCNGMYASGVYGAVRALTDATFRDRNAEYVQDKFAGTEAYCILTRVTVENGETLTPDWTLPEYRLFEWSKP